MQPNILKDLRCHLKNTDIYHQKVGSGSVDNGKVGKKEIHKFPMMKRRPRSEHLTLSHASRPRKQSPKHRDDQLMLMTTKRMKNHHQSIPASLSLRRNSTDKDAHDDVKKARS
eukprot:1534806-Amphidinium_carterae.1